MRGTRGRIQARFLYQANLSFCFNCAIYEDLNQEQGQGSLH